MLTECFDHYDTWQKIETNTFHPQKLINMHIYDNQLYAKVEDLNVQVQCCIYVIYTNFYLVMTVWLARHFKKMKNTSV